METSRFTRGLGLIILLSLALYLGRILLFDSFEFGYMLWNLLLALIPLLVARYLSQRLDGSSWLETPNLLLTVLWLGFLPNSFYLVTDLIHVAEVTSSSRLYTAVMMFSYGISGLVLGYTSVVLVHRQLIARLRKRSAAYLIALVFLLCSYAIYLGRYMRWNTWDLVINPLGLLSNIADSLVIPRDGAPILQTTVLFFVLIGTVYLALLQFMDKNVLHSATSGKQRPKKVK